MPAKSQSTDSLDGPTISVVIPTRDRGKVILRAVESALHSPRRDIEVVVVDDGSSDDTERRLSRVADERLLYHRLNSTGNANRARNIGVRLSHAPVIALLDSDDAFGSGRVDRLIAFFSRRHDVDCLVDGYVEFSRGEAHVHRMPDGKPSGRELRRMLLMHLIPLTNSAITVRRSAFKSVGGYDEAMPRHHDRELLLRLAQAHSIWLGEDTDVEKHRSMQSVSHEFGGYIEGLDALAARCDDYELPENELVFRYLVVRGIVKALATGHWLAAYREFDSWRRAKHLPKDYLRCLGDYRGGRRQRAKARAGFDPLRM